MLKPAKLKTFKMRMPFVVSTVSGNELDMFGSGWHRMGAGDWWVCYGGFLKMKVSEVLR